MDTSLMPCSTLPADMEKSRLMKKLYFSGSESLPVSFIYGGRKTAGIPGAWNPASNMRRIDANIMETVFEGNDTDTGLCVRVECTEYLDYPVLEWVAWFTNKGNSPTPVISDINAMECVFEGTSPVLYHCNGDIGHESGYAPQETPLNPGDVMEFAPNGGRPTDGSFSYFRICFEGCGMSMAVGWPGQWAACFEGCKEGAYVTAGQQKTNIRLFPGESIRTPRMTVMSWTGDTARAINLWRRWYLDHILPRPDGKPLEPKLACCGTDPGDEFTNATEENQLKFMKKFKDDGIDFDVWWIDAGWYPCLYEDKKKLWPFTGTWRPDPDRFPEGFGPVSDFAGKNNAKLLVWFEPERVVKGTQIEKEHPEWISYRNEDGITDQGGRKWMQQNGLLNLGIPECRQWLTDHVCKFIRDNGIGIYRQDFNYDPLRNWRENEPEDRSGINENLYVQGFLKYWDDLLARNPGLWIDSCASGGRRNDLETMRRSVPLHYTDYGYGHHAVKTAFNRTLYSWIPYFKEFTIFWDVNAGELNNYYDDNMRFDRYVDPFSYHCGMAPMMFLTMNARKPDYDFDKAGKLIAIWRKAADTLLNGDFYALTPYSISNEKWAVFQFDRPEEGTGLIQGRRFANCGEDSFTVNMHAIHADSQYVFENPETGETMELAGKDIIANGFTFRLPRRSAAIWFYRR